MPACSDSGKYSQHRHSPCRLTLSVTSQLSHFTRSRRRSQVEHLLSLTRELPKGLPMTTVLPQSAQEQQDAPPCASLSSFSDLSTLSTPWIPLHQSRHASDHF